MDRTDELLNNSPIGTRQDEQAVVICLQFPIGKFEKKKARNAILDLDSILREIIETSCVGRYHGHKFIRREHEEVVKFFITGEDASSIYREIKPILQSLPRLQELYIIKQFSQFNIHSQQ